MPWRPPQNSPENPGDIPYRKEAAGRVDRIIRKEGSGIKPRPDGSMPAQSWEQRQDDFMYTEFLRIALDSIDDGFGAEAGEVARGALIAKVAYDLEAEATQQQP